MKATLIAIALLLSSTFLPQTVFACDSADVINNGGCSSTQYCNETTETCVDITNAQGGVNNPGAPTNPTVPTVTNGGGGVPGASGSTGGSTGGTLTNPLTAASLTDLIAEIIKIIVDLGAIFLTLMLIFVGFKFVAARGNSEKVAEARSALLWTVIGGLLLLGASAIATAIASTAQSL